MAEIIFILVTFYGFYVIYSAVTSNQTSKDKRTTSSPLLPVARTVSNVEEESVATNKKSTVKNSSSSIAKLAGGSLRNPETGEVAKIASSYRMCKRWIKDALVAEGLLEDIYKTSEVDALAKVKIETAFNELVQMEKYQYSQIS